MNTRMPHLRAGATGLALVVVVAALVGLAWPRPDANSLWKQAEAEFAAGRYDQSAALLKRVGPLRAPTPLDRLLAAKLAMAGGRTDEALANLAQVPDDHPQAAQARFASGQLELRRDRFTRAEGLFQHALKLDPRLIQARRELVFIYGMQLRRPELNAAFRALAEEGTLNYGEVFLWCLTRGVSWEPEEIVKTLARCIEADPTDRWARLGRAEGLRDLGRFDEAEQTLAPLPDSDPDARVARVRLALARGEDEAAEKLLDDGPTDHAGLALLRGQLALVRNDGPGALRHYRIAHAQSPHEREAVLGLGQALMMTGDPTAAAPFLEEARRLDRLGTLVGKAAVTANRDDPALIRDLGAACQAVGRTAEAQAWYQIAVDRDPLDTKAQQALVRLKAAKERDR